MPPETSASKTLQGEVDGFRADLVTMLSRVLERSDVGLRASVYPGKTEQTIAIRHDDRPGIGIYVDGEVLFRLEISYRCKWNDMGAYFAVEGSSFTVRLENVTHPIMSFDYNRSPGTLVPASHINFHANNDEVVYAMMASGRKKRGKSRALAVSQGKVPRLAELHLPTGGHRFRPCLEDVLEMLILEFGVDVKSGWKAALDAGRTKYRLTQLRTAVSDAQEEAADLLREIGWTVTPPENRAARIGSRFGGY